MKIRKNGLSAVLSLPILFLACSVSGPSEANIRSAIQKTMATQMSGGIGQAPLWSGREQVKVDSVSVVRRGDFNEAGKYYPVQAKFDGSYVQKAFPGSEAFGQPAQRTCTFSAIENFRLSKNDYGEWTAQLTFEGESSGDDKLTCDK